MTTSTVTRELTVELLCCDDIDEGTTSNCGGPLL